MEGSVGGKEALKPSHVGVDNMEKEQLAGKKKRCKMKMAKNENESDSFYTNLRTIMKKSFQRGAERRSEAAKKDSRKALLKP